MNAEERALLEKQLNNIIADCLFGPVGDPDSSHLWAASRAFVLLERLGLLIRSKREIEKLLNVEAGGGTYLAWARSKKE